MATRITVRLTGDLGLDGAGSLLRDLERRTGLSWRDERPADEGGHLDGGFAQMLLYAVAARTAEMAFATVVERVRESVDDWRKTHLDPPDVAVETVEVEVVEVEVAQTAAVEPQPEPESGH